MAGLRILIENPLIRGGGSETMLQLIVEYFKGAYHFDVLTRPAPDEAFPAAADPAVRWIRKHTAWKMCRRFSPQWFANRILTRLDDLYYAVKLSSEHYDIAISMAEGPGMRHVDRIRAARKIAWIQKDFRYQHNSRYHFASDAQELACMRRFDRIVCVSETARQGVIETIGDPGNLCVLYNPIDHERIRRLAQASCETDAPKDRPLVLSVGGLREVKNYPMLLDACRELHREMQFDLWIVGEGPDREQLERRLREEELSFVRLLGARDNPYPLMRQADVYVSASRSETYGLSIQESLILGVPVVAVRNPGVCEAFDERFGLLTENNAEDLKRGLARMLGNENLRNAYRQSIAEYYATDGLYEKRFEAIRELFESSGDTSDGCNRG